MPRARLLSVVAAAALLAACGGGAANPQTGARYSALLPVPAERASRALLSFDISADGTRVEYLLLEIDDLECAAVSAEHSTYVHLVGVPIESGRFTIEDPGVGVLSGEFTSADRARGEVTLRYDSERGGALTNFTVRDRDALCDLGEYQWEAQAGQPVPFPTPPPPPGEPAG